MKCFDVGKTLFNIVEAESGADGPMRNAISPTAVTRPAGRDGYCPAESVENRSNEKRLTESPTKS